MLVQHAKTAASLGIPEENMLIINNGDAVALTPESIYLADRVHAGIELVDSSRTGMVHDRVLKERQQLAEDGVVSASVAVDASGKVVGKPEIQVRGVVGSMARTQLDRILTTTIVSTVAEQWSKHTTGSGSDADTDWTGLQAVIERDIQRMLRRELQCEPLVLVLAHQVEGMSSNVDVPDSHPVQVRSTGVDLPIAENTVSPILEASGGKSSKPPGRRRTRSTARAAS
jgi:ribonuclease J